MRNLTEANLTDTVVAQIAPDRDARFRAVATSLIRHLHAFVRDTELTEAEWLTGIQFLTATGHKSDDRRQEFILLSDALGVSMLVDAINHRKPGGASETTVLGPFYRPGAPHLPLWANIAEGLPGVPTFLSGRVLDTEGRPLAGATLDVWQTDSEGMYDVQQPSGAAAYARGRFAAGADGGYGLRTVKPVSYAIPTDGPVGVMLAAMGRHPFRPAHVHLIVSAPGFAPVTTHLFVAGDPYLDGDAVFAVKESLIVDFVPHPAGPTPDGGRCAEPFCTASFDFHLVPLPVQNEPSSFSRSGLESALAGHEQVHQKERSTP
jgi:hydroxyquinol 1,2-dioxygenase